MILEVSADYPVNFQFSEMFSVSMDAENCENEVNRRQQNCWKDREMDIYIFMQEDYV